MDIGPQDQDLALADHASPNGQPSSKAAKKRRYRQNLKERKRAARDAEQNAE